MGIGYKKDKYNVSEMVPGFGFFLAADAFSASYDCGAQNLSRVERLICADQELSVLDDSLSSLYKRIAEKPGVKSFGFVSDEGYVGTQRAWLLKRNKCQKESCIRKLYFSRLKELSSLSNEQLRYRSEAYLFELLEEKLPLTIYRDEVSVHFYRRHYGEKDKTIYSVVSGSGKGIFHNGTGRGWCGGEADFFMAYMEIAEDNTLKRIEYLAGNSCAQAGIVPEFRDIDDYTFSMGYAHDYGDSKKYDEFLNIRVNDAYPLRVTKFKPPQE